MELQKSVLEFTLDTATLRHRGRCAQLAPFITD